MCFLAGGGLGGTRKGGPEVNTRFSGRDEYAVRDGSVLVMSTYFNVCTCSNVCMCVYIHLLTCVYFWCVCGYPLTNMFVYN